MKPLAALLDDVSKVLRIGVDGRPEFPEYLRACDIAVNLIAELAPAKFSFVVNRLTNYSSGQLAEVKHFAAQYTPPR